LHAIEGSQHGAHQEPGGPAGQPVEVVRGIRDDIDTRVQQLLAELVPAT
jgi:hypothetical protein